MSTRLWRHACALIVCISIAQLAPAMVQAQVTGTLSIAALTDSVAVPQSYIGFSHEPMSQAGYYSKSPVYVQLVNNLVSYNTGPLSIRWGGNTQDVETQIYGDEVWQGLNYIYNATNRMVQHHIPINLAARNISAAVAQINAARKIVNPSAVGAINVGNEPDSYMYRRTRAKGTGNFTLVPSYMTDAAADPNYLRDQLAFMNALAPALKSWLNTTRVFSGPAIANPADCPTSMITPYAALGNKQYVKMYTIHYYTINSNDAAATMSAMLADSEMTYIRNQVVRHVSRTKTAGIQFRLDETNSMSSSGKFNVSDTLGAALFMIDYAFNVMQVGCAGMNFHDSGCSPYSPILFPGWCGNSSGGYQTDSKFLSMCPSTCGQPNAPALVNAPYFGMWFVQRAIQDAASLTLYGTTAFKVVTSKAGVMVKAYAMRNAAEFRVVVVNKGLIATNATISITGLKATVMGSAQVLRLVGNNGLNSKYPNITFAGQNLVAATGKVTGNFTAQTVKPVAVTTGYTYTFEVPAASAALAIMPIGSSSTVSTKATQG